MFHCPQLDQYNLTLGGLWAVFAHPFYKWYYETSINIEEALQFSIYFIYDWKLGLHSDFGIFFSLFVTHCPQKLGK